ncbi:CbiX/SirB N-terminal domain-containing protein [Terasakiella sp. A23]|uniref:CbiX/SirB N-terminal domain-containing protein n=1 Tax=Terasakiella sp. FCG-A23 TaxID=3080561 RepID=UPI0029533231|nr:CbiX/SirB N-terminal domain-containing protein [Terasakiella sp. A23]MDV7341279.1 CbiX/SirB N-terminal domain-containing protein [Terasakiella sp. A23]
MSQTGLHVVVVGHGSTKRPDAAVSTNNICRKLFDSNRFDAVHCAFMKQELKVADLFSSLPSGIDLEVVPHFAAAGAFVEDRLAGFLKGEASRFRKTRMHQPLGLHPGIARHLILQVRKYKINDVIIAAHGSTVSKGPARTAQKLCDQLAENGIRAQVLFLSNAPHLDEWRDLDLGHKVMVCPIFAGKGTHLCEDVPNAFDLPDTPHSGIPYIIEGRQFFFEYPLLDDQLLAEISLEQLSPTQPL